MKAEPMPKSTQRSNRIFLWFFILIGIGAIGCGIWNLWRSLACARWPTTEGRIESAEPQSHSSDDGETYSAEVAYSYSVAGTNYMSSRVAIAEMQASAAYAQAILKRFPVGQKVLVHYSRTAPEQAVLELGIHGGTWICFGVGTIFVLFGWMFLQWFCPTDAAAPSTGSAPAAARAKAKAASGEPPVLMGVIFIVMGGFTWVMVWMDNVSGWIGHAACGFFVLMGLFLLAYRLKNKLYSKVLMWLAVGVFLALWHWVSFGQYFQRGTSPSLLSPGNGTAIFALFAILVDLALLGAFVKWLTKRP